MYYNYEELRAAAIKYGAPREARLALLEWLERYGRNCWNGECYDIEDNYSIYPVYDMNAAGELEIIDCEVIY